MPPKCQDITPLSMESVVLLVFIYLPFMNQTQYPEGISWCPAFLSRIMLFCNVKHHKLSHGSDYNFMWWKGFIEWVFPVFTSFCLLNRLWLCLVTSLQPSKFPNEFFGLFVENQDAERREEEINASILEECVPGRMRILDAMTKKMMKNYNFRL